MQHSPASPTLARLLASLALLLAACSAPSNPASDPSPTSPAASAATPLSTPALAAPSETRAPSSTSQVGCPAGQEAEIDPHAVLELGPGPGILPSTATGEKLVIVGTVYAKDCAPLAGASLDVWQTDANGEYGPDHGSNDMRCCYLMGRVSTDSGGRYQLITVQPAHYKGETTPPPAHIHLKITHPQAGQRETEIVFDGDPYLPKNLQNYILVSLETAPGPQGAASYLLGVADIMMNR